MLVRDGMSTDVLTVGPAHTLREAARLMRARRVGSAIVLDGDAALPGILTERDILDSLAAGEDPDVERVADHLTADLVVGEPDWTLLQAARTLVRRNWRHLVVSEGPHVVGVLSVRDVVDMWVAEQEDEQPAPAAAPA